MELCSSRLSILKPQTLKVCFFLPISFAFPILCEILYKNVHRCFFWWKMIDFVAVDVYNSVSTIKRDANFSFVNHKNRGFLFFRMEKSLPMECSSVVLILEGNFFLIQPDLTNGFY